MNAVQVEQKSYEMPPREGFTVAHFLTVADIERSARFYEKVFGAGPVSGAEPGDCCRRSQEAWRARLSLDDPGHLALPAGLRSAAENRDIRPGAVRSDDGAVPALGSQSVVVDVRIPRDVTHINRGGPYLRTLGKSQLV
jgi:hypothetical protein